MQDQRGQKDKRLAYSASTKDSTRRKDLNPNLG